MKREYSWGIVGALAIAATAGLSLQQSGSHSKEGASTQIEHRASVAAQRAHGKEDSSEHLACDDIAKAIRQFLNVAESTFPLPKSCFGPAETYTEKNPPASAPNLHLSFVIATVPDPVHTHLPLLFDRMTEAIQEAAQDDEYSYESSWFPWEDKESRHTLLADDDVSTDRREKQETQPGILLFRRSESSRANDTGQTWSSSGSLIPYQDGLVVLIVGEDPTRGIHLGQFRNAVLWVQQLEKFDAAPTHPRVGILGPSFSGSFHSLEKLLTAPDTTNTPSEVENLKLEWLPIYSGTANSADATQEFADFISSANAARLVAPRPPAKPRMEMEFHHFMEIDEVGLERYCRSVNQWHVVDESDRADAGASHGKHLSIAIISEDETSFGSDRNSKAGAKPEFRCISDALWLYYPRDISSLRAAYQANSVFDGSAPQQLSDVGRGNLPTDLADPGSEEHDTIRSYAGNQTAISQEAYLLGLVNAMREAHTEYIILRSTNSLDQIFLTRYLRRAYPDARIVIDGADNLFERERGSTGMVGTLSITTYPLLERQGAWLASKQTGSAAAHRSFNSDFTEATYVALRMLLRSKTLNHTAPNRGVYSVQTVDRSPDEPMTGITGSLSMVRKGNSPGAVIADYGSPVWLSRQSCPIESDAPKCQAPQTPPTWISVIGRDGFWAIASLNEDTMQDEATYTSEINSLEIPTSMKVALILLAVLAAFHLFCCRFASFTAKPAFLTHFANPGDNRHVVLIFLGSVFVVLLPLLTAWACGLFDLHIHTTGVFSYVAVFVVLTLSLPATLVNIARVNQLKAYPNSVLLNKPQITLSVLSICVVGFFLVFVIPIERVLNVANRFFTYYRSVHLLSGVSPVTPFLFLTIGMYVWFWYSLHGLALFSGQDTCKLPSNNDLSLPVPPASAKAQVQQLPPSVLRMFSQNTAAQTIVAAKPLARTTVSVAFGVWIALILLTWIVARSVPIRSLGAEYYAKLIIVCLLGCFSLMLAEAWQLLTVWSKLRTLLVFLDRTALRRTLAALRGFSWGSVWKMSGNVLDVRYKLMSRQFESLMHTIATLREAAKKKRGDAARCCIAARYCAEVLGKLKQDPNADIDNILRAISRMRKIASGELQEKLDAARDAMLARKELRYPIPSPDKSIEECILALENFAVCKNRFSAKAEIDCIKQLKKTLKIGQIFAGDYADIFDKPDAGNFASLCAFQDSVAETSGFLLTHLLLPDWQEQKCSLILDEDQKSSEASSAAERAIPLSPKDHIRNAEEFVCLPYLGFVQNILGRIRTLVMGILCLFVATAIAISSYPFDPRQGLGLVMLLLFVVLVGVITYVYAQIHRDNTLSHITNTTPGELGSDFWLKLLAFGLAPLLGLLTAVFPSISDFVFSWLQPGLQSMK